MTERLRLSSCKTTRTTSIKHQNNRKLIIFQFLFSIFATMKLSTDAVLFPRTINKGNEPEHIDREQFTAEMRGVEGMGETWLITQNGFPHVVSQVVTTKNESEFDLLLGRAMANHIHAEWVKGCTDFFVLISGWNDDIKWQQATCDRQMAEIFAIEALAAKWWHCYREDIIKGQEGKL